MTCLGVQGVLEPEERIIWRILGLVLYTYKLDCTELKINNDLYHIFSVIGAFLYANFFYAVVSQRSPSASVKADVSSTEMFSFF